MTVALFAALLVFCGVQDRITSIGTGQYVVRQRAALAGHGPAVTIDAVMDPWIARSVRLGLAWGALPIGIGVVAAAVAARRHRRA